MTQPSTGKPLGYYGVDTSLPEVQELEKSYGSNLQNMSQALTRTDPYGNMASDQTEGLIKAITGNL